MTPETIKPRAAETYNKLAIERQPFLSRARENAKLSIPALVPPDGHSDWSTLPQPYQSLASRGANNLAAKFALTFLPPNRRMFRLMPKPKVLREEKDPDLRAELKLELEKGLQELEREAAIRMEQWGFREAFYEICLHLQIAGNCLQYFNKKTKSNRVYPLSQFVVRRDREGTLIEGVIHEVVDRSLVPAEIQKKAPEASLPEDPSKVKQDENVDVYTHFYREDDRWVWYQEAYGQVIPNSIGKTEKASWDKSGTPCPFNAIRWTRIDGESYGRAYMDDCYGDVKAAEVLSRSLIRSAAIMARTIFTLKRGHGVRVKVFKEAIEGDFIEVNNHDDVQAMKVDKYPEMSIAKQTLDDISRRLGQWFLLTSTIQRNAERQTAEEWRQMVQELNDALGGITGTLTKDYLLWLVRITLEAMREDQDIPATVAKLTDPIIITGVDSLGRTHERKNLEEFLLSAQALFGPENLGRIIHLDEAARRLAIGADIDQDKLVKTKAEVADEAAAAIQNEAVNNLGGPAIKAISDNNIAAQTAPQA